MAHRTMPAALAVAPARSSASDVAAPARSPSRSRHRAHRPNRRRSPYPGAQPVVNIAWQHHHPSLELLEFPGGKQALRFNAFYNGDPVNGPLVLDREAIVQLARAAAGTKIQALLKELAAGEREED